MKCAWCPKAATTEITVQPARYQSKRGIKTLIAREIKAPACEQHAAAVTEDRTPPQPRIRVNQPGQATIDDYLP